MFRRKMVLAQGLCEEKSVYDCLNKLMSAQTRVSEQQLRWAKAEENPLFLCLFGRMAELTWMGNELIRQFQDKQTELNRVFRDIDQEEKIVDESRKALLSCKTKCLKLQKQLEHSKKKNDTAKIQSVEIELTTQGSLREHLKESVETQSHKLELYKVDLLKKGLKGQAQTYMDISFNYQALFNAQLQLAEMLCFENSTPTEILEELTERNVAEDMKLLLSQVTETLNIYPPANGGVNVKKLSEGGQSPPFNRRHSSAEEPITKPARSGKPLHSISQPVLVGHRQNGPLEDLPPNTRSSPLLLPQGPIAEEDMTVMSGEYCEIESPGIPEENNVENSADPNAQSSPVRQSSTQALDNDWTVTKQYGGEQPTTKGMLQHHDLYHSTDSVTNDESHGSSSSVEDLKAHREVKVAPLKTTPSATELSDECYANPVDAINEFLLGKEAEFSSLNESETNGSPKFFVPQVDGGGSTANSPVVKSPGEPVSLQTPQSSKEIQLQLFHERLFKDQARQSDRQNNSEGSSEVDAESINNRTHDYSEIDDEPTYSNPFDALAESSYRPPFRVKTDKLRRNVSLSTSAIQIQPKQQPPLAQRHSNSPPPPPLPLKDEKVLGTVGSRPIRYCKVLGGENETKGMMMTSVARSVSIASVSVTQQQKVTQRLWDRREPVWKRKNSQRRGSDENVFQQQPTGANSNDKKPEVPISLAERVRQLRQRSQSDGLTLDEVRLQSRPPMPLPIMEQEPIDDGIGGRGELKLNGQSQHLQYAANSSTKGGGSRGSPARQKKWLERTVSDSPQPVYYARRGVAQIVPLSAREIVKQHIHISHAAT